MKNITLIPLIVSFFGLISGSLYGVGEKTIRIGAEATWKDVEIRLGITELPSLRPYPVLTLSSARTGRALAASASLGTELEAGTEPGDFAVPDMVFSFDEGRPDLFKDRAGHYLLSASPSVSAVDQGMARAGTGAVFFEGDSPTEGRTILRESGPLTIYPEAREALLSAGRRIRDFSLEFWLYPLNMETGEQILTWSSTRRFGGEHRAQRIRCGAARNRLQWSFDDFFVASDGVPGPAVTLNGASPITPRTWSHHLIRFDADTGLFEYLVNGNLEDIRHVTASGREGAEVYTPLTGDEGVLVLGGRFRGLVDELMLYSAYVETPPLQKYPNQGGRIETRFLDLGEGNSEILRVEAYGGRASNNSGIFGGQSSLGRGQGGPGRAGFGGAALNEYAGTGGLSFSDNSALRFFIRAGETARGLSGAEWIPVRPGTELPEVLRGRFVQLAVRFYPSGDGETTPYLEELRLVYRPDLPPGPPALVTAIARDGAVDLSWKGSPDQDTAGYRVYYGLSRGDYFGGGAVQGDSPINAGNRTSLRIDGLRNGVLYYFAVTAYDRPEPFHEGAFSREVSARPLRMAE
ncbi:MAG: hypothetical protein LBQ38_14305 [Spirochaetaceae bacterium]|jgi:hypothetical protein|nr:hypothetical protein [Spirochaetaceae bacterium]